VDTLALRELLCLQVLQFVIADIGKELEWIHLDKCYDFWKSEIRNHLTINDNKIHLDDFPNQYAYIASKWTPKSGESLILLEKIH
jgi:hypothetical protein